MTSFPKKSLHKVTDTGSSVDFVDGNIDLSEVFDDFLFNNSLKIINNYKKELEKFDANFINEKLLTSISDIKTDSSIDNITDLNSKKEKMLSFYVNELNKINDDDNLKYKEVVMEKRLIEREERVAKLKKYNELLEIYDELRGRIDYYSKLSSETSRNKSNLNELKEKNENSEKRLLMMDGKIKELEELKLRRDELLSKKGRFLYLNDKIRNLKKQLDFEKQVHQYYLKKDLGLDLGAPMFKDLNDLEKERVRLLEIYRKKKADLVRNIRMCKEDVCRIGDFLDEV